MVRAGGRFTRGSWRSRTVRQVPEGRESSGVGPAHAARAHDGLGPLRDPRVVGGGSRVANTGPSLATSRGSFPESLCVHPVCPSGWAFLNLFHPWLFAVGVSFPRGAMPSLRSDRAARLDNDLEHFFFVAFVECYSVWNVELGRSR